MGPFDSFKVFPGTRVWEAEGHWADVDLAISRRFRKTHKPYNAA